MRDEIVRAITSDGLVQAAAVTGRSIVERARNIHTTLPVATAALGRALMAASLMGDALKGDNSSLTLQIKGGGPLGTVLAVSDSSGNVRGYVQNPHVELMEIEPGKLDVGRAVGETGTLTVMKDLGMKEPYVGSIGMFTGEIADDIAMYFVESEQIPTACALGVLLDTDQSVTSAGGYLIQLLPGADLDMIEKIEAGVRRVGAVSKALQGGMDAEDLLRAVLSDFELEVLDRHDVEYRCYCTRQRVERALISMGREELSAMLAEQGEADLTCQFCDNIYHFTKEELESLLAGMGG
ncbi:MAG: Hsp33 family molecular chaperone HslO [Oscillospiraceae bacterium]|nr:Hsp33 family molecular chaperone HslO [Oscillospiraceae bacterium]